MNEAEDSTEVEAGVGLETRGSGLVGEEAEVRLNFLSSTLNRRSYTRLSKQI
jgi:hypothetical protein